jgi:hypothetical protein
LEKIPNVFGKYLTFISIPFLEKRRIAYLLLRSEGDLTPAWSYTSYFLVSGILALAIPKSFLDVQSFLNGGDMLDKLFGQGKKNSSHCAHIVYWECEITKCNEVYEGL